MDNVQLWFCQAFLKSQMGQKPTNDRVIHYGIYPITIFGEPPNILFRAKDILTILAMPAYINHIALIRLTTRPLRPNVLCKLDVIIADGVHYWKNQLMLTQYNISILAAVFGHDGGLVKFIAEICHDERVSPTFDDSSSDEDHINLRQV